MIFLITGCGRSGTAYVTRALQLAGLDVEHERMGKDGAVSSVWCAPFPPYPSWHQQGPRPRFDVVLHQVREPLATIASVTTGGAEGWRFNARWIPIDLDWHVVKRAAHYWYWWNRRAEDQAVMTYRVENLEARWPELMDAIGWLDVPYTGGDVLKDTNSRRHVSLTWDDVSVAAPEMVGRVRRMAERYGYKVA